MENENLLIKIERADAEIKILRELLSQKDERITHIAEEIGETRSMLIRKDQEFKEVATRLEKLQAMVQDLDPAEIAKALAKRDQKTTEGEVRIEKLESTAKDMRKSLEELHQLLGRIEGFESLVNIHKEVDEKVSKLKRRSEDVMRIAEKVESTFFELDKRLREFDKTALRVQKVEDIYKDIVRSIDNLVVKIENAPNREDMQSMEKAYREELASLKNSFAGDKIAAQEGLGGIKDDLKTLKNEFKLLQGHVKEVDVFLVENSKSNEAISLQVKELYKEMESSTESLIQARGEVQNSLKEFSKSMGSVGEQMASMSRVVEEFRKRYLDIAASVNELSLNNPKMLSGIEENRKTLEAIKTDISMLEGNISYITNSVEVLSSRLDAVKENLDTELKEAYIERKRFMDSVSTNISNSVKASEETNRIISNFNAQMKAIVESLAEVSESLEGEPTKEPEQVKSSISSLVKSLEKLGDVRGKN